MMSRPLTRCLGFSFFAFVVAGCRVDAPMDTASGPGEVRSAVDPEADPFGAAEEFSRRGRFLEALQILDRVPSTHADFAEARMLARALERRIRTSHELILEGLELRRTWQDDEALGRFQQALGIWSNVMLARGLLEATRSRMTYLDTEEGAPRRLPVYESRRAERGTGAAKTSPTDARPDAEMRVVTTTPVESGREIPAATPLAEPGPVRVETTTRRPLSLEELARKNGPPESRPANPNTSPGTAERESSIAEETHEKNRAENTLPDVSRTEEKRRAVADARESTPTESSELSIVQKMRRRRMLGDAASLLRRGNMDRAQQILENLWRESPGDVAVATQFVRVLHQKALLAYGQGRLDAAIGNWDRILQLDHDHAHAPAFLRAARTELTLRKHR